MSRWRPTAPSSPSSASRPPACSPTRRLPSTAPSRSQFVYRPEWARHPNGARGLLGVSVIAEEPSRWAPLIEKYFGAGCTRRDGTDLVVDTGTQPIRYLDRRAYAQRYPGVEPVRPGDHPALLSIRVASLAACAALL